MHVLFNIKIYFVIKKIKYPHIDKIIQVTKLKTKID